MKEEHLDAEVVAGWADGSLDPQARASAEAHAAECVRCQAVLAAMVRTEPAVVQPGVGWFGARVRVFVPLATAAAALALWVALSTDALAPGTAPEVARRAEPKAAAEGDRAAATPAPAIAPSEAPERRIAPDETRRRPVDGAAPPVRNEASVPGEKPAAAAENVAVDQLRRDALRERPAAAPTAVPPTPAEPPGARQAQVARVEERRRDPLPGRGAPPAPSPATAQAPPPPVSTENVAVQTQAQQAQTRGAAESQVLRRARISGAATTALGQIASPDPAVRYRIGAKGMIERTTDGGRTWIVQRSGVQTDLVAAAAPSIEVCWVVGRSGVVLLTIDGGATWRRVPFPEATDLQTVEASDARTATVRTSGGRGFRTADGGVTWQR